MNREFHAPSAAVCETRTPAQRAADALDWGRLRAKAIEPLLAGVPARWVAFDFTEGPRPDGTCGMQATPTECDPRPVIILEGAYSSRPELADIIDLTVLGVAFPLGRRGRLLFHRGADARSLGCMVHH
jgi:uridine kinase